MSESGKDFPDWETLYKSQNIETMPWYNENLDSDLEGISGGYVEYCHRVVIWYFRVDGRAWIVEGFTTYPNITHFLFILIPSCYTT